ncbi:hypothetical protein PCH_Pc14g02180 [Penicillium rubens Wisconsin 54-1255]|uniref:Uncharacterized protein n=1 Tax=Penicillium rubens (strain ATCC 28089 / DSM 1075 / NRRL 1951 / Wisconsin 54-1255) TaxID=500485 RepID=B6H645_PENRW|nr:hypothetical protein PCH_Pc14g02180 [Penicillium rubens Wisconsin 54-1255]
MDDVVDGTVIAALVSALFSIFGLILVVYPKWLQEKCAARDHIPYYKLIYYGSIGQAASGIFTGHFVVCALCRTRLTWSLAKYAHRAYNTVKVRVPTAYRSRAMKNGSAAGRYWPTLEQYYEWLDVKDSPGNACLRPGSSLAPGNFSAEARRNFWGLLPPLRGAKAMFLLAASPTPGTSSVVPGAMAYPSGSGRMSQFCAEKYGPRSATAPRTNQYVPRASVYSVRNVEQRSQGVNILIPRVNLTSTGVCQGRSPARDVLSSANSLRLDATRTTEIIHVYSSLATTVSTCKDEKVARF